MHLNEKYPSATCGNCFFSEMIDKDLYLCHKNPPVPVVFKHDMVKWEYPVITKGNKCCSKHREEG